MNETEFLVLAMLTRDDKAGQGEAPTCKVAATGGTPEHPDLLARLGRRLAAPWRRFQPGSEARGAGE
jgi:hypothetical protein